MRQMPDCFYRISVKALILNENHEFLLIRQEDGRWDLPGGGLDFGESPHQCLERELQEEMGLSPKYISGSPSYFFSAEDAQQNIWLTER